MNVDPYFVIPFLIAIFLAYLAIKVIGVFDQPEVPKLYFAKENNETLQKLLQLCPILHKAFIPFRFGGCNGHFQTFCFYLSRRANGLSLTSQRHYVTLLDETTGSFDVFEPLQDSQCGCDITLAVCPGIANSSQERYMQALAFHAQNAGYRAAILNHTGVLTSEALTSNRIFSYGIIDEYAAMIKELEELYPSTTLVVLGFSMGGNIVTKYLAQGNVPQNVLFGASIGQGYDALASVNLINEFKGFRRFYDYLVTAKVKKCIHNHYDKTIEPHVKTGKVCETMVRNAKSLQDLDEYYTRRVMGFDSVCDFYNWSSCINSMEQVKVPMVYLNALDDPLVPKTLLKPPKKVSQSHQNTLYVEMKHGGHLGFFEDCNSQSNSVKSSVEQTWLESFLFQLVEAAVKVYK